MDGNVMKWIFLALDLCLIALCTWAFIEGLFQFQGTELGPQLHGAALMCGACIALIVVLRKAFINFFK